MLEKAKITSSLDMTLGSGGSLGFTERQSKKLAIAELSFLSFQTCDYLI